MDQTQTQTPKAQELVMVLYLETPRCAQDGHSFVVARPRHLDEEGHLRCGVDTLISGWNIEDLQVQAWYSNEFKELNFGSMYHSIHYHNIYSLNVHEAQTKAKTLARLEQAVERDQQKRFQAKDYTPQTFGAYVQVVAKAMKIKRYFVCSTPGTFMHQSTYLELTPKQAIEWLNSKGEVVPEDAKQVQFA